MNNPILVEVLRGSLVESRHRGAVAVADADGATVLAIGDVTTPIFPRSAVKALQALPLVETGAADAYGFGDEELALACASHSGEPGHVAGVTRMLAKAGLDAAALRCGAHWPMAQSAAAALARTGEPSALHNNCSGKHAGFLCVACAKGIDHADYWRPQHPVQREVRAVLEDLTGAALERRSPRHRRLLGADLGDPAAKSRPRLRQIRHRARPCAANAPAPRRDCARPARKNRGTSPAPGGSAPRSCSCSARGCS